MNLALLRSRVWAFGPDSLASRLEKVEKTQEKGMNIKEFKSKGNNNNNNNFGKM